MSLEARGGIEPRAFPPGSSRFGLEDRCRERGPFSGGAYGGRPCKIVARIELAACCLRALPLYSWSYTAF